MSDLDRTPRRSETARDIRFHAIGQRREIRFQITGNRIAANNHLRIIIERGLMDRSENALVGAERKRSVGIRHLPDREMAIFQFVCFKTCRNSPRLAISCEAEMSLLIRDHKRIGRCIQFISQCHTVVIGTEPQRQLPVWKRDRHFIIIVDTSLIFAPRLMPCLIVGISCR